MRFLFNWNDMYVIILRLSQTFSLQIYCSELLRWDRLAIFKATNLYNLVHSLIRVSVLQLFPGMKNTHDSYYVAEKNVDRIKSMEPVQLAKMIQPGKELRK